MTMIGRNRTIQNNQILVRFLVREIWNRKFWYLLMAVLGASLATLLVYLKPPQYEAKATFIADSHIVPRQVEFLESRDLFRSTMDHLDNVKIRCYSKGIIGREMDYYDRTPVAIVVDEFPEHLKNLEMQLEFMGADEYELSFEALGEKVRRSGRFGNMLELGSIVMVLEPTIYWTDRLVGDKIWFQVHSLDQVVSRAIAGFRVENTMARKNRIAIYYTDSNRERAYDILNVLSREALAGYQRQADFQIASRVKRMENRMSLLLDQMAGYDGMGQMLKSENLNGPNREIDSMVIGLQTIVAEKHRLRFRDSLLQEIKRSGFAGEKFHQAFNFDYASASDADLVKLLWERDRTREDTAAAPGKLRELNVKIQAAVTSIIREDSLAAQSLNEKQSQMEDRLITNVSLRRALVKYSVNQRDQNERGVVLWEEYLSNAHDKYLIEYELVKDVPQFDLVESPFVRNQSRRFIQVRRIISGGLLAMLLMFAFTLFTALGGTRVRSLEHLNVLNAAKFAALTDALDPALAARNLHVALEMDRMSAEKIISVIGPEDGPEMDDFVDFLADRYRAAGRKVMVLREKSVAEDPGDSVTELSIRLLSQIREDELQASSAECDLVIQQLPGFREYPEAWYPASGQQSLVYLVHAGSFLQSELRDLEEKIEQHGFKVYFYLMPV